MFMPAFLVIINHLQSEHNIRASILSLEYSLSPEHVWPKALDEATEAYQYLSDTIGIPSSKIILAGDSAGGNLVAATLLLIKSRGHLSQPAGAALISPWIDLTTHVARQTEKYAGYYVPDYKNLSEASRLSITQNPLISPLYGDFSSTCPIFLAYGDKELLKTSIENFRWKLEKDGVTLATLKGENARHIWVVNRLVASSKENFRTDCKIFVDWMASIINGSSHATKFTNTQITHSPNGGGEVVEKYEQVADGERGSVASTYAQVYNV